MLFLFLPAKKSDMLSDNLLTKLITKEALIIRAPNFAMLTNRLFEYGPASPKNNLMVYHKALIISYSSPKEYPYIPQINTINTDRQIKNTFNFPFLFM